MRNHIECVSRLDVEFGVVGTEMGRHLLGAMGFIIAALMKADGKGLHRSRALRLHQRHNRGRIDPARQKSAERYVGNHPQLDGIAQQRLESIRGFVRVGRGIVAPLPGNGNAAQVPEALRRRRRTVPQGQDVTGGKFLGFAIDRARLSDIGMAQVTGDGIRIDRRFPMWSRTKGLQLRGEENTLRRCRVVERLDAEAIARQGQRPRLAVPQREGKHADRAFDRGFDAPKRAGFQQHLGIGVAAHGMAGRLQLAADVAVIVDFTIEGDDKSPIGRMHRLRAAGAEIDDGKPPLAQRHAAFGLDPDFAGVRPAMPHRLDHGISRWSARRQPTSPRANPPSRQCRTFPDSRIPLALAAAGELVPKLLALVEADGRRAQPARSSLFALCAVYHTPRRNPVWI